MWSRKALHCLQNNIILHNMTSTTFIISSASCHSPYAVEKPDFFLNTLLLNIHVFISVLSSSQPAIIPFLLTNILKICMTLEGEVGGGGNTL